MSDDTAEFLRWLVEANGYAAPVELPGGRFACLDVRPFNTRIVTARIGDRIGIDDAW
jgi:hypothetical protein